MQRHVKKIFQSYQQIKENLDKDSKECHGSDMKKDTAYLPFL
jgi:hypothetical protein